MEPEVVMAPAEPDHAPSLIAPETQAAGAASMSTLLRTLSTERPQPASERVTPVYRSGPTFEDMVREEMRPMLKQWLDDNLPDMVERLVRAEIEAMVGRARL